MINFYLKFKKLKKVKLTIICPNCGIEIGKPTQKFCEKCGVKLTHNKEEEKLSTSDNIHNIYAAKRKLFDLNQEYYILKEDYWKTGSGYIYDSKNQIIGIIDSKKKKKIELKEADNTITATIHFKSSSFRGATELLDHEKNLIAKLKKKKISDFHSLYFLEDPRGTRWYEADGEFINFKFKIEDLSINKIVAECNKTEKWKDVLQGGNFNHNTTYSLKILDRETDRRILLLFVIGIRQIRYFRMF